MRITHANNSTIAHKDAQYSPIRSAISALVRLPLTDTQPILTSHGKLCSAVQQLLPQQIKKPQSTCLCSAVSELPKGVSIGLNHQNWLL